MISLLCTFRVIIHIVSRCHEEGLDHYLRSFVKVTYQYKSCYSVIIKINPHISRSCARDSLKWVFCVWLSVLFLFVFLSP